METVRQNICKADNRTQVSKMTSHLFERNRDMEKVIKLLLTCKEAKSIDHFLPFMLRLVLTPSSFLSSTSIDLETDVRIWNKSAGTLCGFALVDLSVWGLFYLVSPSEEGESWNKRSYLGRATGQSISAEASLSPLDVEESERIIPKGFPPLNGRDLDATMTDRDCGWFDA